jgi:hypothetical protein
MVFALTAFSISICYLVGKGLPTYCVTRAVGRQPLAASDKQSNQWTLKTLYYPFGAIGGVPQSRIAAL